MSHYAGSARALSEAHALCDRLWHRWMHTYGPDADRIWHLYLRALDRWVRRGVARRVRLAGAFGLPPGRYWRRCHARERRRRQERGRAA